MEEVLFGRESPERGVEQGLLEQAHGGIIYFDEVADMPLGTQSKILRVLVDQSFTRVGGTAKVRVDLRVISSTTRDLAGRDRRRPLPGGTLPPAQRGADRGAAAGGPARGYSRACPAFHRSSSTAEQGLPLRELGEDAVALLQTMSWPGNVRQLRNVIERVLILGDGTGPIEARDLPSQSESQSEEEGDMSLSASLDDAAAARGARAVRASLPAGPDQPVRRQYQPHGELRGHGTLGPAPQAEVAGRRDLEQGRRARGAGGGVTVWPRPSIDARAPLCHGCHSRDTSRA
jgi:hypothetical protein